MIKKIGILMLGFLFAGTVFFLHNQQVKAGTPGPSMSFTFESGANYNFPTGTVEFVEIAGKKVAKRVTPDVADCVYIENKVSVPFEEITNFAVIWEQYGSPVPASLVTPLLSPDGVNWYYWNQMDSEWKEADVENDCGWGIDNFISPDALTSFTNNFAPGMLYFRIYLGSGTRLGPPVTYTVPIVEEVSINYEEATECESSSDCTATQYCKKNRGECDSVGVCHDKPTSCPLILLRVCGCDEVTYSNGCLAAMGGASINYSGTCAESCTDNILNQDEEEIDCGGVCDPCTVIPSTTAPVFVDVPDTHPHSEAINYLQSEGIVSGYDATHFGPDLKLRRGELLKIALNGAGVDSSSYLYAENPYSDLDDDHTLKQYILYAYHNDIATGYGDGTFGADNYSSQAEAAKMLLNINEIEPTTAPSGVTYNLPAGDLRGFVHQAMEMNLLYDSSNYVATNDILRGYAAEIMYRILMVEVNGWEVFEE